MNKGRKFIKIHKNLLRLVALTFILFVSPILFFSLFVVNFYLKIYPNVYVNKINVGQLTEKQAIEKLNGKITLPSQINLYIEGKQTPIPFESSQINASLKVEEAIRDAYKVGRTGSFIPDLISIGKSLVTNTDIEVDISFDQQELQNTVSLLNNQIDNPPVYPSFQINKGDISVNAGSDGQVINEEKATESLLLALKDNQDKVTIKTEEIKVALGEEEKQKALEKAKQIYPLSLTLWVDDYSDKLAKQRLLTLFNPRDGLNEDAIQGLSKDTASLVNRDAQKPIFKFENERVTEFSPSKDGLTVNENKLDNDIKGALLSLSLNKESQEIEIPVTRDHPSEQIGDINNLGIKELLGRGTSKFSGSISSRVHNVALASSRINGVLVAPGDIFSFAKAVGDVSKYTGYKEAYIIQNGRTILGDGGGVCQVSTTLFRAVMNAGLPIIERHSHAYRVGYYEQDAPAGYDATVYVPSVDFKFRNDTQNYILVQTKVDTKNLTAEFSIYGTSDGRKSKVTKPVLTNQIPPPDDLYVDDPTLPAGKIQQVEHKAWGGTSTFYYTVEKDGKEIFNKKFVSVYQPWQAVFMRGTGQ